MRRKWVVKHMICCISYIICNILQHMYPENCLMQHICAAKLSSAAKLCSKIVICSIYIRKIVINVKFYGKISLVKLVPLYLGIFLWKWCREKGKSDSFGLLRDCGVPLGHFINTYEDDSISLIEPLSTN